MSTRVTGSVAGAIIAVQNGADIVRVHDVKETKDGLMVLGSVS
jgi:dihydropteroate synthase